MGVRTLEPYQIEFTAQQMEELLIKIKNLEHEVKESDNPISAKAVYCQFDELKALVDEGKKLIATAITKKGIVTEDTDTFHTMAVNIGNIQQGGKGVDLFCFPLETQNSTTVYLYGTNASPIQITENITERDNIYIPNVYYFDNINTMKSVTLFMYGKNKSFTHITEDITELDEIKAPNLYYFNNIKTMKATVILWNHNTVDISNEREEY